MLLLGLAALHPAHAQDFPIATPVGAIQSGLRLAHFFHLGILSSQLSKLFGEALMPSWIITLTEPVGSGFTLDSSLLA